jgi:hypothetical protein
MKNYFKLLWIIALVTVTGFVTADDGIRKSITITGLRSFNGRDSDIWICTDYPWDSDQCVANEFDVEIINGSVTFRLENDGDTDRWTGSGSYYIYFDIMDTDGDLEFETVYAPGGAPVKFDINFANTPLAFSSFKNLDDL